MGPIMQETVYSNARIVLADEVVVGSLVVRDGLIADIGTSSRLGEDMEGDLILPGLIELHTDQLENHFSPRPGVRWNALAAVQAHDAQVAASGITTVFDAIRVGTDEQTEEFHQDMRGLADAVGAAMDDERLRAEHFIHLRCEVSAPDCLAGFALFENCARVKLASLMDHAPGQRQFTKLEAYEFYYKTVRGLTDAAYRVYFDRRLAESQTYSAANRAAVSAHCLRHGITLASHDDATDAHVEDAIAAGVKVAEFPTTVLAAQASHEAGMAVLMGAPNIVRGGSHSGNVAAGELARAGLLDVLSSDYVPFSLMQAIFVLSEDEESGIDLPQAVKMVSARPAEAAGLDDRGTIAQGKRADLVRVALKSAVPIVRAGWRQGRRVI